MFEQAEAVCKIGAAFVTADHKRAHLVACEQCLGMFQRNSKEFLRRYVTVDGTWIHYYTPETKNQNVDWAWQICAENSEDGSISR